MYICNLGEEKIFLIKFENILGLGFFSWWGVLGKKLVDGRSREDIFNI